MTNLVCPSFFRPKKNQVLWPQWPTRLLINITIIARQNAFVKYGILNFNIKKSSKNNSPRASIYFLFI